MSPLVTARMTSLALALFYCGPAGPMLQIAGDVYEAQRRLCELLRASDCSISYDPETTAITIDLNGIDPFQNEGALLLEQLVDSEHVYNLTLGNQYRTAAGLKFLGSTGTVNNSNTFDPVRFRTAKPAGVRPPAGVDALIAIDPANAKFLDSEGRQVPLFSIVFHELAEAYSKVDLEKPYLDFELGKVGQGMIVSTPVGFQRGAHNDAVQREIHWRSQMPGLQVAGRAGDVLTRDPNP
jgi:hypothetical protein